MIFSKSTIDQIPTPSAACSSFIEELHRRGKKYRSIKQTNHFIWGFLQIAALLAGFGASIIAGLGDPTYGFYKPALVILPLVGTLCGALVTQFRLYDQIRLFANACSAVEDLVVRARANLSSCKDDVSYTKLHRDLAAQVLRIYEEHYKSYYGLFAPDFVASLEQPAAKTASQLGQQGRTT